MHRDDFIIAVYCLVCQHLPTVIALNCPSGRLRLAGFPPKLSDEEAITIEICGEFFKMPADKDIFAYFRTHYQHFFPKLRERTLFVRQIANLQAIKNALWHHLTRQSQQDIVPLQSVDTMPLPVCQLQRREKDKCFKPFADLGYCSAKKLHYYGFKLGLRISLGGMITHFPLLGARPHDVTFLPELVSGYQGIVFGDKGFLLRWQQELLAYRHDAWVVTLLRPRDKHPFVSDRSLLSACGYWRRLIETVGSQLVDRFSIQKVRVHDLWHLQHRLIRKVLSHTIAVFLNWQSGRSPLDFEGLVTL